MEKNDFRTAATRAEAKHGAEWQHMSTQARTEAIYRELRELDRKAAAVRRRNAPGTGSQGEVETLGSLASP